MNDIATTYCSTENAKKKRYFVKRYPRAIFLASLDEAADYVPCSEMVYVTFTRNARRYEVRRSSYRFRTARRGPKADKSEQDFTLASVGDDAQRGQQTTRNV